jgi:hypothetical protein
MRVEKHRPTPKEKMSFLYPVVKFHLAPSVRFDEPDYAYIGYERVLLVVQIAILKPGEILQPGILTL